MLDHVDAVQAPLGDVVERPHLEQQVEDDAGGEPGDLAAGHRRFGRGSQPGGEPAQTVDVAADESDGDTEHFGMEVEREGVESHAHCVIRSGSRR